jgi:hypothetical protein
MKNSTKAALFGGTLLAAGMSANAQSFNFQDSGSYASTPFNSFSRVFSNTNYGVGSYTENVAPTDLNNSITAYGSTASASVTSNNLRVEAEWDGTDTELGSLGYAGAILQQFFTVNEPLSLDVTWDLTDTDFFGNIIFFIENDVNTVNLSIDSTNPTGSLSIPVDAGNDYGIVIDLGAPFLFAANDPIFINAELVPAPGAFALMGAAGLAGVRRRRA